MEEPKEFKRHLLPLGDRVLIKVIDSSMTTPSGLTIPGKNAEKPVEGKVQDIGADVTRVSKGKTVLFEPWIGKEFKLEGENYYVCREEDLLGVIAE